MRLGADPGAGNGEYVVSDIENGGLEGYYRVLNWRFKKLLYSTGRVVQ